MSGQKSGRESDDFFEKNDEKDLEVIKKCVSLQPISEERVLERATKASRVVQIIDNIGKDNEVKAKKEKTRSSARNSGTAISRQTGLQEAKKDVASCAKARGSASRK